MLNRILPLLLLCVSLSAYAQYTVRGRVIDASTQEPLARASVFCQGTTLGTSTDKDGLFELPLRNGGYDLTISYTGYLAQVIRVNATLDTNVQLVKKDNSLGEVVLRSSNEDPNGWEKYGSFFTGLFIGESQAAKACVLRNPEVLRFLFYKKSNRLKVLADEPLIVVNPTLGYEIRYELDSFVYNYNTQFYAYRGYPFFTELTGEDSIRSVWAKNRESAYLGSKLQFMHNYYDSTLTENGWLIEMMDEENEKRFNRINAYDTLYYGAPDSTGQMEIWYPRKICIIYTKQAPESDYLKKMKLPSSVPYCITYVDLRDAITVRPNGYFYNQSDWIQQGYWVWKNLGDQLPNDYEPD